MAFFLRCGLALLVAMIVLAGCTNEPPDGLAQPEIPTSVPTTQPRIVTTTTYPFPPVTFDPLFDAGSFNRAGELSPMFAAVGVVPFRNDAANLAFQRDVEIAATLRAIECMETRGFRYFSTVRAAPETSQEWAAEWGLGVSTRSFGTEMVGPGVKGYVEAFQKNPNAAYTSQLSDSELNAYRLAASGGIFTQDPEEMTESDIAEMEEQSSRGCFTLAHNGKQAPWRDDFHDRFADRLDALFDAVPRPDLGEQTEVVDCLKAAGSNFSSTEEAFGYFNDRVSIFAESLHESLGDGEWILTDAQNAALAEMQADEIRAALTLRGCDTVNQRQDNYQHAIAEAEAGFLSNNSEEITQFKATHQIENQYWLDT